MSSKTATDLLTICIIPGTDAVDHCGMEYYQSTSEAGRYTSPEHPDNYPNNVDDCPTLFYTDEGQVIQLEFESFDLESHSSCSYDRLEVTNVKHKFLHFFTRASG